MSLPYPLSLYPPCGISAVIMKWVFTHTAPNCRRRATRIARAASFVHTDHARPAPALAARHERAHLDRLVHDRTDLDRLDGRHERREQVLVDPGAGDDAERGRAVLPRVRVAGELQRLAHLVLDV